MGRLIDGRTSQNASYGNSISIPILVVNTPQLFGQIGLNTAGVGDTPRVQLKGTIALQLPLDLLGITISVVRGTEATDPLVFSMNSTFELSILSAQILTFSANDYNPPIPDDGLLVYTAFVSSDLLGTIRVGPENFDGILISE
ncbi:hypothetical protein DFQ01_101357 [Paenibacillus cellulosilyticus]|uniref:Uncharacterized protein n=1 Tax=Paenibacillus cellulosilyticus TaxID=375489 RepID=A0A2V2Z027_9BACL|nr:hypothetical protein [Paenibacillus cellulosilyticus]PWW08633.1 hypothetical protein DFQ01_101357 [Paenibacillus cellulosilyticus]QKS48200.1 hypothetical protein HUB94_28405 [Paenibacillus cellulosilyticus]